MIKLKEKVKRHASKPLGVLPLPLSLGAWACRVSEGIRDIYNIFKGMIKTNFMTYIYKNKIYCKPNEFADRAAN